MTKNSGMNFQQLQEAQAKWVYHNFPQQVEPVTSEAIHEWARKKWGHSQSSYSAADVAAMLNYGELAPKKYHGFLGAVEEMGELAHAYLKAEQGIRNQSTEDWKEKAEDAVADCIIFLASFCNTHGMNMQRAVETAWAEVEQRDWVKYPKTGRPE